jgi:hypothetical protein
MFVLLVFLCFFFFWRNNLHAIKISLFIAQSAHTPHQDVEHRQVGVLCTFVFPALKRLRNEDHGFEVTLGSILRTYHKKKKPGAGGAHL